MSTITSLKLGSVPITEEGVERYRFSDNIENHFTQIYERIEDLNCSVGRVFSKMKVAVSWYEVMNANYLIADMEINNPSGSTLHIKGWIDAIDLLSDSDDYPLVEIRWHFDYYEMWKANVTLGYGHVKRRPFNSLDDTPIQNYPKRYEKLGTADISVVSPYIGRIGSVPPQDCPVWWIILSLNWKDSDGNTRTSIFTYPVYLTMGMYTCYFYDDANNRSVCGRALYDLYSGLLDEFLGDVLSITTDDVNGVWISPICPFAAESTMTGVGSSTGPITIPNDPVIVSKEKNGVWRGMYRLTDGRITTSRTTSLTPFCSSEQERYCLTSTDGVKILDLPYNYSVDSVTTTLLCELDNPYFEISFKDSTYGNLEGMTVNIPLTTIPLNSNAYTAYVYSGQQEYDRSMRTVRSNSKALESTSVQTASGALIGGFGQMGAIAGAGIGLASGLLPYASEMLYSNDKEQALEDRLRASQPSVMVLTANSLISVMRSYCFKIKSIIPDDYSLTQITNTRNNFGISVDEILASCDTLVRSTLPAGYYSIKNLIISGAAPKEAKDYIKNKFDAGVKLL